MTYLPIFEYTAPKNLGAACSQLSKHAGEARVLAGGTDLVVEMKHRKITPHYLVNIKHIPGLDHIQYSDKEGLRLGTLVTMEAVASSPIVEKKFSLLSQAAGLLGTAEVRNRATIGGNLCHASPSAETAPALIALSAKVKIVGAKGERVVPLEDFFLAPRQTVLQSDEILVEIQIPNLPPRSGGVYLKHSLRRIDVALVGVAAVICLEGQRVKDIKIVLGAVAPTPIRARKAEKMLTGQQPDARLIEKAAQLALAESRPIDDIRSRADYRREMVGILTREALEQALSLAGR